MPDTHAVLPHPIEVRIPINGHALAGDLVVPDHASALVIFAHGSGSGRHSPRNRAVAVALQQAGLATLLLDLLTHDEEWLDDPTHRFRFDIPLLASRLRSAVEWALHEDRTKHLPIQLFGASTGAAAALVVAAGRPDVVHAVVSRGGRPDLAGASLPLVRSPTLLIVGGRDADVLELNRLATRQLRCPYELSIVPGATHLFEEPGALERVAELASAWFTRHSEATAT